MLLVVGIESLVVQRVKILYKRISNAKSVNEFWDIYDEYENETLPLDIPCVFIWFMSPIKYVIKQKIIKTYGTNDISTWK